MKASIALTIITALVCPILATPVPDEGSAAVLEPRTNYEFYSWVSLGCPGAASIKRFTQNKCVALPGASTKLATPDGSCTTRIYTSASCTGSSFVPTYNVCYDTRNYNSIRVNC